MKSIFSYESTPMQILMFLGDLIILNFIFLVCCFPIFTIGAAQAGLHTGIKVLLDKEDDSSPAAAFFRGFTSGFGTVTLSWGIVSIILVLISLMSITAVKLGSPVWMVVVAIAVCGTFQSLIPLFHARFRCTAFQLVRNSWFLLFAHPLRSLLTMVLVWGPVLMFLLGDLYTFMAITPIWGTLYFSSAYAFINPIMKKPFKVLVDHFNETHGIQTETPAEANASEENEEAPALIEE